MAIPVFFLDKFSTLQSSNSSQVTSTWKKIICKIPNKAVAWYRQWYNLAKIQNPVSCWKGFLWPICVQCWDVNSILQNTRPTEWKIETWWLFPVFHISGMLLTLWWTTKPVGCTQEMWIYCIISSYVSRKIDICIAKIRNMVETMNRLANLCNNNYLFNR